MATAENVNVRFTADTAGFDRRIKRTRDGLKTFTKEGETLKRSFSGLFSAAGAFGPIALAIGGATAALRTFNRAADITRKLVGEIVRGMQDLDRVTKLADKLGLEVQDLRRVQFAAGALSGMSSEATATALQRMARRVAEAAAGMGEAQKALRELGLDAGRLNRLGPDQQFLRIADALRQVRNPTDQLRLAFKLFDSEGAALVSTLRMGSAEIERLGRRADMFGGVFSEEDLARVEAANDAVNEVALAIDSLTQRVAVNAAPTVLNFAQSATREFRVWADLLGQIQRQFDGIAARIPGGGATGRGIFGNALATIPGLNNLLQSADLYGAATGGARSRVRAAEQLEARRTKATQEFRDAAQNARTAVNGFGEAIKTVGKGLADGFGEAAKRGQRARTLREQIKTAAAGTTIGAFRSDSLEGYRQARLASAPDERTIRLRELAAESKKSGTSLSAIKGAVESIAQAQGGALQGLLRAANEIARELRENAVEVLPE